MDRMLQVNPKLSAPNPKALNIWEFPKIGDAYVVRFIVGSLL